MCLQHVSLLYTRSPYSVPKLLLWRQPWLPRGQGWTTTQLCSYWTVYWLTDPTPSTEHYPPDDHPLLQWPLREQARIQTDLSGWVHVWFFWLIKICYKMMMQTLKATNPEVLLQALPVESSPSTRHWENTPAFKLSLLFSFSISGVGNTSWLCEND